MRGRHRADGVAEATREAELSQRRQDAVRKHIVRPLQEAADRNQFAELIRRSLTEGHR